MKYIQALKEQGYNLKTLPTDIKKAINLVLKSKDYNSKVEALDYITFNSIRNSQPVDERIEELHKLSLTDHSVEDNNGFNTPLSIDNVEEEFASGGHIATKDDNNKVRNWKVRFHLGRGENFMNWKVENPKTNEVNFYKPDEVQIEMFNCKLTNSPATANKIFTGKMDKSPIAWVVCEKYKVSKKIDPVDADERLTYNPRTAPNWFDTDGDNVDNYVFEKLITFGRGVYYETPDGKLFALGGMAEQEELPMFTHGGHISPSRIRVPNVRGGWTKEKIVKYFKEQGSDIANTHTIAKYISEFDNWQQFKDHIYYHGTTNYIEKGLKPSMAFSERWAEQQGGGGYGDRYFGISLTKRKRTAEIFSGQNSGVTIYPVILKRDAKVIERTDLQDASDVEDIIVELYEQGVDAVWIGGGEEELVVVNPFAILLYKKGSEYHSVYGGFKSVPLTDEKIKEIYDNALKIWEDYSEAKSKTTSKEERDALINSLPRIQFETGGVSKYHLGGDMSKHLAPNGKPSNLTHEQWHLVRTPEFKKWFGDWENDPENSSKVVDENGEPLVVYHGTNNVFYQFEPTEPNFYAITEGTYFFTDNKKVAENFGDIVLPVFLQIDNPTYLDGADVGRFNTWDLYDDAGNYGFIVSNSDTGGGIATEFAVEHSEQIKLADGSNSKFDRNNPDIRFETGGQTKKSGKDIYENNILQIRIIGGEPNYYKRVNQEWKFLSPDEVAKLKVGTKHELEHSATIEAFKRRDIPNETIASFIAYDHLNEDPNYYQKLDKAIPEQMAEGKKIEQFPEVVLNIYANNEYYRKTSFSEKALIDVANEKIKFTQLDTGSGNFRIAWKKVYENSNGYYIDYDYFGGRIFIENWYTLCQENKPEQMARGKKIDIPVVFKQTIGDFKIWIEEVFMENKEVRYGGEIYFKDLILQIFPAVGSDLEALKKIMRNYIARVKITANKNAKNIIFIDGKTNKVSETIYNYVLAKSLKQDPKKYSVEKLKDETYQYLKKKEIKNLYFDVDDLSNDEVEIYHIEPRSVTDTQNSNLAGMQILWDSKEDLFEVSEYSAGKNNDELWVFGTYKSLSLAIDSLLKGNSETGRKKSSLYDENGILLSSIEPLNQPKQPTPEPTIQPTPEIKKEEPKMENNQPTGSVSNWNEVPVRWKNVKAVRPMTFNLNPYDKGLNSIVKEFLGDDALRPVMTAMNFGDSGVVSTDAHKLLHIHYKNSDFRGNYATANTLKALKSSKWKDAPKDLAEANEQIKDDKYPNWIAVIPKDNPFVYEVDIMKLYQYVNVAINYANKTTYQVAFRYDKGRAIGFNGKFLMQSLEAMMKIQKCTKVYLHLSEPSRAMLVTYEKSISPTGNTYVLVMPVMVNRGEDLDERGKTQKLTQIFGTADIDNNKYLNCYFDFEDSQIHNGDGSIADYKESYGDAEEMPLALITMLDKFIKLSKNFLPILNNVCVDGNGIRVDNLEARIEIANDWKIPQGLYRIEKNAMVQNTLDGNLDDFPQLNSRVPTKDPVFTIDTEVFKYYVLKASEHIGDDDLRPMMKSILFQYDQGGYFQIVSTSGYTLFHANVTKYASQIKNKKFTFPVANVKELINFTKNIDSKEIKFYVNELDDHKYRIDGGRLHFEARISDGKFPNWEAVTPIKYSNQLSFDIKDLFVCMNNEVAKTFAKSEDLKPNVTTIFNQDDKIFIGNFPKQSDEQVTSKEICNIKIKKETFSTDQSFNTSSSNYVLLMPQMRTNGNYFNFAVDHLNDTISTIGKERVIVNYTDLSRAYIFTSDNLDYKTSDVYKPEKAVTTPVKNKMTSQQGRMEKHTKMVQRVQAEQKTPSTNFKTDKYGRLEPNATQLKMQKTPVPEMDQKMKNQIELLEKEYNLKYDKKLMSDWGMRYIELRRKIYPDWQDVDKYFGKKIGSFKVGDVIGSLARNTDTDREVVLERTNGKVYVIPYNYAYPKIREYDLSAGGWELIEPKQNLLVVDATKKQPTTPPEPKNSGKNPSEFNVGDIIEYAGVTYEVKTPKTKDNFSLLINLSDKYRKGDIDEFANTEHTKKFKLVSKSKPSSIKKPSSVQSKRLTKDEAEEKSLAMKEELRNYLSKNNADNYSRAKAKELIEFNKKHFPVIIELYEQEFLDGSKKDVGRVDYSKIAGWIDDTPFIKVVNGVIVNNELGNKIGRKKSIGGGSAFMGFTPTMENAMLIQKEYDKLYYITKIDDKLKKKTPVPVKAKPKDDTQELQKAIKGLEAFLFSFGTTKTKANLEESLAVQSAIKGLKALLK